eukprot:2659597-Alexandrium_andersonii.AAC.1
MSLGAPNSAGSGQRQQRRPVTQARCSRGRPQWPRQLAARSTRVRSWWLSPVAVAYAVPRPPGCWWPPGG